MSLPPPTNPGHDETDSTGDDSILAQWVAELADRIRAGQAPDLDTLTRDHPERAEQVRQLLPAILLMAKLGPIIDTDPAPTLAPGCDIGLADRTLGEFQLLREVGRGGMGVVYEALEVPLGRRVALKVLPFATALDPRQLKRFQLEAQAVASLNHRNIVPIYSVGRDRGFSYFAMQLINGRTLADVGRELRQFEDRGPGKASLPVLSDVTRSILERPSSSGRGESRAADSAAPPRESDDPSSRWNRSNPPSSLPPTRGRAYFRAVADLGRQAAEALAHVHDLGIQHRDIKPANLLVDNRGQLWVTDFGLARLQGDGDQTRTGDMIGTLRYMSPEQALARPGLIDHRTDIYSLGATLYELITLRPAFAGDDRQNLLMRIVEEEPVPLRRLDPTIPTDLETIVTKAMAREPSRRYLTAQALADDLKRFLEGRPILARRPSPVDGAAKWVRRRWPLVATAAALVLLFVALSIAGLSWSNARLRGTNERLEDSVAEANRNAMEAARLQSIAREQQRLANRHLYATRIRSAHQALEEGRIEWAQEFLEEIKPGGDGSDPRHFAWHYLRRLATREIEVLRGHDDPINYVTVSPDGRVLATRDTTDRVLLWDALTGRLRAELAGKTFAAGCPEFSTDSRLVIATEAAKDGSLVNTNHHHRFISVWDATNGRRLSRTELYQREGHILELAYNPSDHITIDQTLGIQWFEADRTVSATLWRLTPDYPVPQLQLEVNGLQGASFVPGGRTFGTWEPGRFQFRDRATGSIRHQLSPTGRPDAEMDLSPDGRLAVLTESPAGVMIYDTESGIEVARDPTRNVRRPFSFSADSLGFTADGNQTGLVHLWDKVTNQWQTLRPDVEPGAPRAFDCTLSPNGARLALSAHPSAKGRESITLWGVPTLQRLKAFPGRPAAYSRLVFAPDGQSLFLARSSDLYRWTPEPTDGETPRSLPGHSDEAWAVAFSPDGRILASGSNDTHESNTIKLWDVATGQLLKGWRGHEATVTSLAFSPDGRSLASGAISDVRNVKIWEVATGRLHATLVGPTWVRSVAYSPDGTRLAAAGNDHSIWIWDLATEQTQTRLQGHTNIVQYVAFSPDGRLLASAGDDRTVRIWDLTTGTPLYTLDGPEGFMAVAFAPDGALLATASESGQIALWDPASGTSRGSILCDDGGLRGLTFSPNGALIAAAGVSQTIHLWDVVTRQELMNLSGHQQPVNDLAFTTDGMTLASCSHDGAIKLWEARPRPISHDKGAALKHPTHEFVPVNFDLPSTYFQDAQ